VRRVLGGSHHFPYHRGEFHSLIAGSVVAGAIALFGAPLWFVIGIFVGATWFFIRLSRANDARELQDLVAWRQQAIAELGMCTPITPYHPLGLARSRTLVEGVVGNVHVKIRRDVSGSDVGPDAWYSVELESGTRSQYENLDDKLTRNEVFPEVKRLLAAFHSAAG
jgi:hypothetical protein